MFGRHSEEIERLAGTAAVSVCWSQWVALGSPASRSREAPAVSMLDPEALVLLSLCVRERERRLLDLVGWWARVGSHLTSVQRLRSVAARFPDDAEEAVALFAAQAETAGDRRWSRHASDSAPPVREKGPDAPSLEEPCTLWLRLRAGFGVGAKADTLAFLLGAPDRRASARTIAFATGYSSVAARTAAGEMAMARFIRETGERPIEYTAPADAWANVVGLPRADAIPPWRFWSELFAFVAGALGWARASGSPGAPGSRVLASRARDLMEEHARAFELNAIAVPRPDRHPGLEAVDGLLETTRVVAEWMQERV